MKNLNKLVEELRETLGKMEVALGSINEAIVWTDEQAVIQWCNAPFDRLVERLHIQVLGANLINLLPLKKNGTEAAGEFHPLSIVLQNRQNSGETYEFNSHGRLRILDVTITVVSIPGAEKASCFVLSIQDITKRHQYENALIKQKEELNRFNDELSRFQEVAVGREERMIELKREVNELSKRLGGQLPYDLSFLEKV